jgi:hypothetical protein
MGLETATKHSLTQARSGLFAASQSPALRIVHARSRYHLRRHRGRICRLCLRCLNMWPGCALPTRPHRHPNHEREQQLRDGGIALFQAAILVRPLRARTSLSVWDLVPSELEKDDAWHDRPRPIVLLMQAAARASPNVYLRCPCRTCLGLRSILGCMWAVRNVWLRCEFLELEPVWAVLGGRWRSEVFTSPRIINELTKLTRSPTSVGCTLLCVRLARFTDLCIDYCRAIVQDGAAFCIAARGSLVHAYKLENQAIEMVGRP